jgi:ParB family chromosome partitioning protein
VASDARLGENLTTKTVEKITLSPSRAIPFDKLMLSRSNVRRIKASVSVEKLAKDIARLDLLQSLSVHPVLDADGTETGKFEIPAGGRRFQALSLLVKQKRLAKTTPIPCIVRNPASDILAEDDSLVENMQRVALHPLDQFRAFVALRDKGQTDAEIAAAFFVTPQIVKQRLKLAAVAPALLEIYAEDDMTLEQLMAFTVNPDHARQVQVWDVINSSWNNEPFQIRRMLTETSVQASDRRAVFVGVEAYEAAGGTMLHDLFQSDDGGWLEDPALPDRLVTDKLQAEAETVAVEGWKWIEVALDLPYNYSHGLWSLSGDAAPMTDDEGAGRLKDKLHEDSAVHDVDSAGGLGRGVRLAAVGDLGEGTVVTPGGMLIGIDLSEHQEGGANQAFLHPGQSAFVIHNVKSVSFASPAPQDNVVVYRRCALSKASDQKARKAVSDETGGKALCRNSLPIEHPCTPSRVCECAFCYAVLRNCTCVAGIKNRTKIGSVGHKYRRLQASDLVCFAQRRSWIERCVEGRGALCVESPSITLSAAPGERFTRIDWVEGAIERTRITPSVKRHQAKTPASTASMYSRTCCALPSCTNCIAVWPSNPGRGSERYQA